MDAHRITMTSPLESTGSGCRIFSTEDFASSTPISRMRSDTARPDRYSIRPCPNGWSESGFWPASWKPSSVTKDEPASERLLNASAVMAMEPESIPAKNFPAKRKIFSAIPTAPQRMP